MKKLAAPLFIFVAVLASCKKEVEPEPPTLHGGKWETPMDNSYTAYWEFSKEDSIMKTYNNAPQGGGISYKYTFDGDSLRTFSANGTPLTTKYKIVFLDNDHIGAQYPSAGTIQQRDFTRVD